MVDEIEKDRQTIQKQKQDLINELKGAKGNRREEILRQLKELD